MPANVQARAWSLPAHVDTDALAPGPYMQLGIAGIAPHCLEQLRPEFASEVANGDMIAAGPNFGAGSSREQAAQVLVHLGIQAVIAPSFAGLFYRNAVNIGLMVLVCPQATSIQDGQRLIIDEQRSEIILVNEGNADDARLAFEPMPAFLRDMVRAGGLLPQLKARLSRASGQVNPGEEH